MQIINKKRNVKKKIFLIKDANHPSASISLIGKMPGTSNTSCVLKIKNIYIKKTYKSHSI